MTIRFQLLVVVNSVLAIFVVFFLVFDYRRDLSGRLEDKRVALEEEATILLPAVLEMRHQGRGHVQQYVDTVCGRMQETLSPGHHIAVAFGIETFQAHAHHRASPAMFQAMQQAAESPTHRSRCGKSEIVVGAQTKSGVTVYVSEKMENLYWAVIGDVMRRLTGFMVLALVTGAVVNLALSWIVTRPLKQLVDTVKRIGEGQLGVQSDSFHSEELDYLSREINAMSSSLATVDRDRKMQMAKAREIQENLLPKGINISGLNVAHLFQPAEDVGGDYYDALPLNDGTWLFCVADVTGHGVPAAMSAAMLKSLLIQAADQFTSPAVMLDFINRRFTAVSLAGDFVSMLLVRAAPNTGGMQYASAGHEPAWLLSPTGATRELFSTGTVLGIQEDATWDDVTLDVKEGHRLLMATDGVSETFGARDEMFGRKRLVALLVDCRQLPIEQTTAGIKESLAAFRKGNVQDDDVTVVLLEITAPNRREGDIC